MMSTPLPFGTEVEWTDDVPRSWRFIWTPGPMTVTAFDWHDGKPSLYALKFDPNGMCIKPGWIYTVKYKADTGYYDPPLSLTHGEFITKIVHEMWLRRR